MQRRDTKTRRDFAMQSCIIIGMRDIDVIAVFEEVWELMLSNVKGM